MIAKKVKRTGDSNYQYLAEYIAAARDPGEKLDDLWIVNCSDAEKLEDLDMAIMEIETVQALNLRSNADKTYHLIVSFRDEKPPPQHLREIEQTLAEAFGFEDHQRVVGTHQNTDNFHMHVAYNKVHPVKLTVHSPYQDYIKLSETCRELERKYDLKIDNGIEKGQEKKHVNQAAIDYEANTWQQSLDGYVKEHSNSLKDSLIAAKSWQDLHNGFAAHGLELKPRGSGMIIQTADGGRRVKASTLGRGFAKVAKDKLGPYQEPVKEKLPEPKVSYEAKPTTTHKNVPNLLKKFRAAKRKPKSPLMSRAFNTWKEFLILEALNDPLAMAIFMAQKQMLGLITPSPNYAPTRPACKVSIHSPAVATKVPKPESSKPKVQPVKPASKSLEDNIKQNKTVLMTALGDVKNWQALHRAYEKYGLEVKLRGNGMILQKIGTKQQVKASTLDRGFAFKAKDNLGPFEKKKKPSKQKMQSQERDL